MQKVRSQTLPKILRLKAIVLLLLVGIRFQVLFHSPYGVLFTFPSRYLFTIGQSVIFSLGRWSSQFPTRLHVSRGTWDTSSKSLFVFGYWAITIYGRTFQTFSPNKKICDSPWFLQKPLEGSHNPKESKLVGHKIHSV